MALKLFTDNTFDFELDEEVQMITEAKEDGSSEIYLEGIFMQAEKKNHNGRIYPKNIMESQIFEFNTKYIKKNRGVGELGHPSSISINLDKISHKIVELKMNGNDVVGRAKITKNTDAGRIAAGLISEGIQLGVSSRGLGTISEKKDGSYVNDDFQLRAVDIVYDPSAPDAFVNGIMEGREWIYENGLFVEKEVESTKDKILRTPSRKLEETILAEFKKLLKDK